MNKILVVDDNLEILSVVDMMLTMNNFIIETVSTWKDINNKIIDFQPNLILLDIRLDGADGRSICKNLHLNNETKKIPIILFSANPENSINLYEWLADDFIPKPFHFSGMIETINRHLEYNNRKIVNSL